MHSPRRGKALCDSLSECFFGGGGAYNRSLLHEWCVWKIICIFWNIQARKLNIHEGSCSITQCWWIWNLKVASQPIIDAQIIHMILNQIPAAGIRRGLWHKHDSIIELTGLIYLSVCKLDWSAKAKFKMITPCARHNYYRNRYYNELYLIFCLSFIAFYQNLYQFWILSKQLLS